LSYPHLWKINYAEQRSQTKDQISKINILHHIIITIIISAVVVIKQARNQISVKGVGFALFKVNLMFLWQNLGKSRQNVSYHLHYTAIAS